MEITIVVKPFIRRGRHNTFGNIVYKYTHTHFFFKWFYMILFCKYNISYLCVYVYIYKCHTVFLCGSVVEHCVSNAKGCGFDSQGTQILITKCIPWMHCKSLWIKASAKCVNVNANFKINWSNLGSLDYPYTIWKNHVKIYQVWYIRLLKNVYLFIY